MPKFMIVTCLFLFWAFYEMSGGADFTPPEREIVVAEPVEEAPEPLITITEVEEPAPVAEVLPAAFEVEPAPAQEAVAEPEPAVAEPTPIIQEVVLDIRLVSGEWVNMRDGPSTAYAVLDTLPRGTEAEIIEVNADGWAQIRLIDSGQTGWMAERLLSDG